MQSNAVELLFPRLAFSAILLSVYR